MLGPADKTMMLRKTDLQFISQLVDGSGLLGVCVCVESSSVHIHNL